MSERRTYASPPCMAAEVDPEYFDVARSDDAERQPKINPPPVGSSEDPVPPEDGTAAEGTRAE